MIVVACADGWMDQLAADGLLMLFTLSSSSNMYILNIQIKHVVI